MTKDDIIKAQDRWAKGVIKIGQGTLSAKQFIKDLYVQYPLMKPTLAKEQAFRTNLEEIASYFVGGHILEDKGFALKPWIKIRFENVKIITDTIQSFAVGHYFFTDENDQVTRVEYSFGYVLVDGVVKINLHHSSLP